MLGEVARPGTLSPDARRLCGPSPCYASSIQLPSVSWTQSLAPFLTRRVFGAPAHHKVLRLSASSERRVSRIRSPHKRRAPMRPYYSVSQIRWLDMLGKGISHYLVS